MAFSDLPCELDQMIRIIRYNKRSFVAPPLAIPGKWSAKEVIIKSDYAQMMKSILMWAAAMNWSLLRAFLLSALVLRSWALDLVKLHDGSPLFGEEVTSPNGKKLTQFLGIPFAEPPIGNLREENVILVSINYRVSVLGFLYLGKREAPGNMGLWDQQLALKWVHENIDVFGGDPTRITLFGESAGAASVNMHMLSPHSTPYFQRAIIQSASVTAPWAMKPRDVALTRAVVLYNAMKCGNFKRTQLLAGSNLDESMYFIVYYLSDIFPVKDFFTKTNFVPDRQTWLKGVLDLLPQSMIKNQSALAAILHQYDQKDLPVQQRNWLDSLEKMFGDYHFTCNVNEMALAHSKHGGDTYYYYFTHRATAQTWPKWMGCLHGYEINFVFGEPFNKQFNYTAEEQELSSRFMRYWANFAKTGDPNKNEDGTRTTDIWPKYNGESMEYMDMTVKSEYPPSRRTGNGPRREYCAFWKSSLPKLMATANGT
ncbi:Carboxylesterase [Teladorsagia circumcincta]|uniref:Carboxylic ester hydrolase n=1 Tax=Teladorsagia circumcincta TaxID=45464 RepID=A0A2G9TZF2_TELCI|nr:Carboxylesterase [Teladorsagia circumcincta]